MSRNFSALTSKEVTRRDFLRAAGAVAAGSLLAACGQAPAPQPTLAGTLPAASTPRPRVAIAQANSYDRKLVRRQVEDLFNNLGGVGDVAGRGDTVAIKVNLTGGTGALPRNGAPATDYHILHPEVVRAVGELLRDAGVKDIAIIEAVYDEQSFPLWGYSEVAQGLGATLVDLNQAAPYPDFGEMSPGEGWLVYEKFIANRLLLEADAFISIAKMKCHCTAGVTLSMKNLVGTLPMRNYRLRFQDQYRSALHGTEKGANTRLPRVIVDLNRARPIHLAVIDGIFTSEGGEGPWNIDTRQVRPGVLLAGKNALATDAVSTAVMGFDPTSEMPAEPFLQSSNHLNLAYKAGLGSNRLEDIDCLGAKPDGVRFKFAACREW